MKELGSVSKAEHVRLIDSCIESEVSIVFTLGSDSRVVDSDSFLSLHFDSRELLHHQLMRLLKPGDTVLFKGSRSMKMEETFEFVKSQY